MARKKKEPETVETPERAITEISRLVGEGFTSGILDEEDGTRTSWNLKVESWKG
jgi:hypothetical protein